MGSIQTSKIHTPKTFIFDKAKWDNFSKDLDCNSDENTLKNSDLLNSFIVNSILDSARKHIPLTSGNPKRAKSLPAHIVENIKKKQEIRRQVKNGKADHLKP